MTDDYIKCTWAWLKFNIRFFCAKYLNINYLKIKSIQFAEHFSVASCVKFSSLLKVENVNHTRINDEGLQKLHELHFFLGVKNFNSVHSDPMKNKRGFCRNPNELVRLRRVWMCLCFFFLYATKNYNNHKLHDKWRWHNFDISNHMLYFGWYFPSTKYVNFLRFKYGCQRIRVQRMLENSILSTRKVFLQQKRLFAHKALNKTKRKGCSRASKHKVAIFFVMTRESITPFDPNNRHAVGDAVLYIKKSF